MPIKKPILPILIVDDQIEATSGTRFALESAGMNNVITCNDSVKVGDILKGQEFCSVLLDLTMPGVSGEVILSDVASHYPHLPVIIVTGANEVETAVRCMKNGAFDYLVKPVESSRVISSVKRAVEMRELRMEYNSFKQKVLKGELQHPEAFEKIVTRNKKMFSLFQYVETVAMTTWPVLLSGETGVGKELFAKALHESSCTAGELVMLNVAGLDDNVFSDTLFGHSKGAFTGADKARDGLIKKAEGGTLFLDEIGDLSFPNQIKLLRLLQEREYYPLGADMPRKSNARIVVATNKTLEELQDVKLFRKDLYHRLQTHHVSIPPLVDRVDDIPLLVECFLEKAADSLGKKVPTPANGLYALLATYNFSGNIRELESMVMDAVSKHTSGILSMDSFKEHIDRNKSHPSGKTISSTPTSPFKLFSELPTLKESQKMLVDEAMDRSKNNQSVASRLLGISQPGLSKALKRFKEQEP